MKPNCEEFPKTKMILSQEDDDTFILTANNVLLYKFTDETKNLFEVKIDDFDSTSKLFSYQVYNITE